MKFLIAIDGSAAALQAVRWVLRLANDGLPVDIVLVNVQEPASLYEVVTAHDADVIGHVRGAAGADLLRAAEELVEAAGRGYESEVAGGVPEHLIVELAENYGCDAIAMGPGRVALAVAEAAPMPVTIVPAVEADEPAGEP